MPPKPKFKKEEIIDAAYRLMEERGIDAVVAREVGKVLGTTTAPIFTYFSSMDELKMEVYMKARKMCVDYLMESLSYRPAFKEFGLRLIRLARENPHIYSMLFLKKGPQKEYVGFVNVDFIEVISPMKQEVIHTFAISEEEAEHLINDMCIFAQGIATMIVNDLQDYSQEEISITLSRMCISYVIACRIQSGSLIEEQRKQWMNHMADLPVKYR